MFLTTSSTLPVAPGAERGKQRDRRCLLVDPHLDDGGVENEHVEAHKIRDFCLRRPHRCAQGSLRHEQGTRCEQFLFSVSLSPPANERVPVETFESATAGIRERNGLTGHPRIAVCMRKRPPRRTEWVSSGLLSGRSAA